MGTTKNAGITPAHAGKTKQVLFVYGCPKDHPRACGENQFNAKVSGTGFGSPPRMRGKLFSETLCYTHTRITPAHAGKTIYNRMGKIQDKDHPRACGEN